MRAEIIAIGTELLLGQVINTNTVFLSQELAALGIDVFHHVTVGDNPIRLKEAIKLAEKRADIIILSGGLGPTEDDVTKQTLSEYLNINLVLHKETEEKIIRYHKHSHLDMPENNQLQALILEGSLPLKNETGLAVGMLLDYNKKQYVLLPGPPDELEPMVKGYLKDELAQRILDKHVLVSKVLRFNGITEAQLANKIEAIITNQTNPTVAIYANQSEITVRLTAKAKTENKGYKVIKETEDLVIESLKDYYFGYGEKRLNEILGALLSERKLTLTAADGLTAGTFLSLMTSSKTENAVLEGGMVINNPERINNVLKVTKETIKEFGIVSPECAIEMAERSRKLFHADIGIGLIGDEERVSMEPDTPGIIWIGVSFKDKQPFAKSYRRRSNHNKNKRLAALNAIDLIRRLLLDEPIDNRIYIG